MPERSMELLSAGCSVASLPIIVRCRSTSVPIMIRSFGLLNGKPISGSSRSTKSRQSLAFPFLIRSLNGSSGRFAVSIWTERFSGHPPISKTNSSNSGITTRVSAPIPLCAAERQIRTRGQQGRSPTSAPTDGNPTAAAYIRHPRLPDISKHIPCHCFGIGVIPGQPRTQDVPSVARRRICSMIASNGREIPGPLEIRLQYNPLSYQFATHSLSSNRATTVRKRA